MTNYPNTKLIPLTQGKFAIVDDDDYISLSKYKWCIKERSQPYPTRNVLNIVGDRRQKRVLMHREIMNAKRGVIIDHINGNVLDNRKINLRLCNRLQNRFNQKPISTGIKKSKYKGVRLSSNGKVFEAWIRFNNKRIYLGRSTNEKYLAELYDISANKYFNEFARTNKDIFPDDFKTK